MQFIFFFYIYGIYTVYVMHILNIYLEYTLHILYISHLNVPCPCTYHVLFHLDSAVALAQLPTQRESPTCL